MKKDALQQAKNYAAGRRRGTLWRRVVTCMAAAVVFCTTYALILPAVTLEGELTCALESHVHTSACYDEQGSLICGKEQVIWPHEHNDDCYKDGELVCTLDETKVHEHTDACGAETKTLKCEKHVHTADCYGQEYVCGKTESQEPHAHTEACYDGGQEKTLTCGEESDHQHTDACYTSNEPLCGDDSEGHTHTDECNKSEEPLCNPHQHTDDCYTPNPLICGLEAGETHTHTEECKLTCGKETDPEHTAHGEECYTTTYDCPVYDPNDSTAYVEYEGQFYPVHVHSEGCYDNEDNLTCTQPEVTDHTHDEKCFTAPSASNAIPFSAEPRDGGVDFGQYITSAVVQKLEGNTWVNGTTFEDGDYVRVSLDFSIPANTITNDVKTLTYQLPTGITPGKEFSGNMTQGTNAVGTYHIGTNGLITITLDDDFANGDAFDGTITFRGNLAMEGEDNSHEVIFDGAGGSITITKKDDTETSNGDLRITKSGEKTGQNTITYTITAESTKGTNGQKIEIGDTLTLTGCTATYTDIEVKKGEESVTGYTLENYGYNQIKIKELPALNAGESYTITYTVNVIPNNGQGGLVVVENDAWSWVPDIPNGYDSESITLRETQVSKAGRYDPNSGRIYWTIQVTAGSSDTNLEDILSDEYSTNGAKIEPSSIEVTKNGDAYMGEKPTVQNDGEKLTWTVPANTAAEGQAPDRYTITYYTNAPNLDPGDEFIVSNTVTSGGISDTETVPGKIPDWDINKKYKWNSPDATGLIYTNYWDATVDIIPSGDFESLTYTDTLSTDNESAHHYAYASELDRALRGNSQFKYKYTDSNGDYHEVHYKFSDGGTPPVNLEITYWDASGVEVKAENNETPVVKFEVEVTPNTDNIKQLHGVTSIQGIMYYTGDYTTYVNIKDVAEGTDVTVMNKGQIPGKESEATTTVTRRVTMTKTASAPGTTGDVTQGSYGSNLKLEYDAQNGEIWYKITYDTAAGYPENTNGELVFTDSMSPGLTYVEDSLVCKFTNQWGNSTWDSVTYNGYTYNLDEKVGEPDFTKGENGNTLRITVPAGYNGGTLENGVYTPAENHSDYNVLVFYYKLSYAADTGFAEELNGERSYNNTVSVSTGSVTNTTTVEKTQEEYLTKSMEQVKDANDQVTNQVKYWIVINPQGVELEPNLDDVTLEDILTYNPEEVDAVSLDLTQTKLYSYNSSAADNHYKGTPIPISDYTVTYDGERNMLTVRLPDELACVLEYVYYVDLDDNANSTKLTNTAELSGRWETSKPGDVATGESSGSVRRGKLTFYKVDADNYNTRLSGAGFELTYWDGQKWTDHDIFNGDNFVTTDENGMLDFTGSSDQDSDARMLEPLTVYRLRETVAPEGYDLSVMEQVFYYFVLMGDDSYEKSFYDDLVNKPQDSNADAYADAWDTDQKDGPTGAIAWMQANGRLPADESIQQSLSVTIDKINFFDNNAEYVIYIENEKKALTVKKVWQKSTGAETDAPANTSITLDIYSGTLSQDGCTLNVHTVGSNGTTDYTLTDPDNYAVNMSSKSLKPGTMATIVVRDSTPDVWTLHMGSYDGKIITPTSYSPNTQNWTTTITFVVPDGPSVNIYLVHKTNPNYAPGLKSVSGTGAEHSFTHADKPTYSITLGASANQALAGQTDGTYTAATTGWTFTIPNVVTPDEDQYWFVQERTSGNWETMYYNNGILTGEITVVNRLKKDDYTLPNTGGVGTDVYTLGGLLLSMAALVLMYSPKRRKKGEA